MKYIHFSIDDVYQWLKELHDDADSYSSMFEHPRFAYLKSLHDRFGATITLNCFYTDESQAWNLGQMTTKYKTEFASNSKWLRLAFHANCRSNHYNQMSDVEAAQAHYEELIHAFKSFATVGNIDTLARTHYFSGSLEIVRAWRDRRFGAIGFLTSDDDRSVVYYLNDEQRQKLQDENVYYDDIENLYFVKSLRRLESWTAPVTDLSDWSRIPANSERMRVLAFFTHEQSWSSQLESKLDDIFNWAMNNGYSCAFPMDICK
jgi:hypothetical protein